MAYWPMPDLSSLSPKGRLLLEHKEQQNAKEKEPLSAEGKKRKTVGVGLLPDARLALDPGLDKRDAPRSAEQGIQAMDPIPEWKK